MVKRKVHYNFITDMGEQIEQRHRWTIAVVNEPREIRRITQRFVEQMAPVNDFRFNYAGPIKNSNGLQCRIFSFSSDTGKIFEPKKIYDSENFRRDRNLSDRDECKFFTYVERFIQ